MNKRKIAVFVEGQAELIFVSDFLLKWYNYDSEEIGFQCITPQGTKLFHGGYTEYGSLESTHYYIIRNIGNDESVISRMKEDAENLVSKGYDIILGLRDMYSKDYNSKVKTLPKRVDPILNQSYIDGAKSILAAHPKASILKIHYAIMEVEAWFLGMPQSLLGLNKVFSQTFIKQNSTKIDLDLDPETTIFHPAEAIADLGRQAGVLPYDKHDYEIINMCKCLKRSDYESLMRSGKCQSFNLFAQELLGIAE